MSFDIRESKPVVSVNLITYNHAPYIRECLDGILMQQTRFPYEVVIGEDESTDGTREICIEYAEKHPDRISLILRSQSEPGRDAYLSQGVYNYIETTKECRGKYVALCDGDDAWTDPLKLQKQFDIMETDPTLSLVHSNYDKLDESSGCRIKNVGSKYRRKQGTSIDKPELLDVLQRRYPVAASTAFLRTKDALDIFEKNLDIFLQCPMGDTTTWCELLHYGLFCFQNDSLCLYRILPESDSNSRSAERRFKFVNGSSNLGLMIGEKNKLPMKKIRAEKVKNCNRYALLSGDRVEIDRLYNDPAFTFSLSEYCMYKVGSLKKLQAIGKAIYQFRYRMNNFLFNTTRFS
ncbi:glycosyltransferase [Pontiellaceae bacterium B1224]|nr:glycosyltransferase [Pontiellaceae bacterium B1224]